MNIDNQKLKEVIIEEAERIGYGKIKIEVTVRNKKPITFTFETARTVPNEQII